MNSFLFKEREKQAENGMNYRDIFGWHDTLPATLRHVSPHRAFSFEQNSTWTMV